MRSDHDAMPTGMVGLNLCHLTDTVPGAATDRQPARWSDPGRRWMDRGLQWSNLAVLFTTGLLPYPTAVLAQAMGVGNLADERIAAGMYGAIGALAGLSWLLLFRYMSRHPALLTAATEHAVFPGERAAIGSVLYLGGGLLGVVVSPLLALTVFVCLPIFFALTSEGLPAWRGPRRRA